MRLSIFSALYRYLEVLVSGALSVWTATTAILPYLVGWGLQRKEVTEVYPDPISSKTKNDLPLRYRGLLYNDMSRCSGCGTCVEVCPTDCITMQSEKGVGTQRVQLKAFELDLSRCVFCGLCEENCPTESLAHTREFEWRDWRRNGLRLDLLAEWKDRNSVGW